MKAFHLLLIPLLFMSLLLNNCEEPRVLIFNPEDTIFTPDASDFTGLIKPAYSQVDMDQSIKDYYQYWIQHYVRESGSTEGGYYISSGGGTGASNDAITVSEAHGFGMVITALMGKMESKESKKIFDGMYKFFKAHPSEDSPLLMAWEVLSDGNGGELPTSSSTATDGDIDIAYGLLLAHSLWGSDGEINYLHEADTIINYAIKGYEVGEKTKRTTLGSWDSPNEYNTRPSDWMTGEFHAFAEMTGESFWNDVVDTLYSVADHIIQNYSKGIGLVPDFVIKETPQPAGENFLEEFKETDEYYMNACRVPMRIMLDVAHYEDDFAIEWMMKIAHWITKKTGNNPSKIVNGYNLEDGAELRDWGSTSFIAPLVTAATISSNYQDFVNKGWLILKTAKDGYYPDCINLMCMLQITGNWWKPTL